MGENLVIVESPAKAKTIEKILGKDFNVKSSFGHIRDLAKKDLGVDINNKYQPSYIVPDSKKKIVSELKSLAKKAKYVWLASDEDREGEAIAWHLSEVLGLKDENTKRIVFHEITRTAIEDAVKNPRKINHNVVQAQQARRVLDRLVGFELSPLLWKKVKPSLSAGRVQSVAVRLLVEKERDILNFKTSSSYKITAIFYFTGSGGEIIQVNAELSRKLKNNAEARIFLEKCHNASFEVSSVTSKSSKRSPAPPFTTSTLQQEAGRKLGFSVAQTMAVAQKLYEAGKITYMRTDSLSLSSLALNVASKLISDKYGSKYHLLRKYKTKSKGAQEAHEAIRPTYLENMTVEGPATEVKLYDLIWKRTIASQMSNAEIEKTIVSISVSNMEDVFTVSGEVISFDGFLKIYSASVDEEDEKSTKIIPPSLREGKKLEYKTIMATEKYSQPPYRYSEASLVKKMEELGIGRPSTYAPTISTIQNRGYAVKGHQSGEERKIEILEMTEGTIKEFQKNERYGSEKSKLLPTDIGMVVNDFLIAHFKNILDYNFTALVEKEFDEIASGRLNWVKMIDKFYSGFHPIIEKTLKESEKSTGERVLGKDPKSGEDILVKVGKYGPIAQIGRAGNDQKPRFAGLRENQRIETISLEEALELFKLPREAGSFEDDPLVISTGKYGPYIRHKGKFYSLGKEDDPLKISEERAIEIILLKREADKKKLIKTFAEKENLKILNGHWGPYISYEKKNFKIPKNIKPEDMDLEKCMEIIEKAKNRPTHQAGKKSSKKST